VTSSPVRVAIGSDDVGRELKQVLIAHLATAHAGRIQCVDADELGGKELDVPEIARLVAERIRAAEAVRGILICGSGVGMVIAANKVPGVRAAQCHDVYTARHARNSDDAQVIVLGSRVIGSELAKVVVDAFLDADFEPSEIRLRRMAKLAAIDLAYRSSRAET
jgi:ribose 5-phosphate isomerase B